MKLRDNSTELFYCLFDAIFTNWQKTGSILVQTIVLLNVRAKTFVTIFWDCFCWQVGCNWKGSDAKTLQSHLKTTFSSAKLPFYIFNTRNNWAYFWGQIFRWFAEEQLQNSPSHHLTCSLYFFSWANKCDRCCCASSSKSCFVTK